MEMKVELSFIHNSCIKKKKMLPRTQLVQRKWQWTEQAASISWNFIFKKERQLLSKELHDKQIYCSLDTSKIYIHISVKVYIRETHSKD